MEHRAGDCNGEEIPKKTRSLDLKSLYETEGSKEAPGKNLKRKGGVEDDDGDVKRNSKRKKSRKAVSINRLKTVTGNGSKSLEEVYNGSLTSVSFDSRDSKLCLSQKSNDSVGLNGVSLALEDDVVKVPRRKRGIVRRRKVENGGAVLKLEDKNEKLGDVEVGKGTPDQDNVNPVDNGKHFESSKLKRKKRPEDFKENRTSESNSVRDVKEEAGQDELSIVKNGESSAKITPTGHSAENAQDHPSNGSLRKRSRKRKNKVSDVRSPSKEAEPSGERSVKIVDKVGREDEEENLEENAARMLSSRFDPSFTGYLSKKKLSSLPPTNSLNHQLSSGKKFVPRGDSYASGSDSASGDGAVRVLRPRKLFKEKGSVRKRRHFYEIFSGELDAHWVLNKRIKVFWPLDESWYYGLVSEYDKERKLHHVKYDDRDEEWINLQNERFKLLLFPYEAPGRNHRRRSVPRRKRSTVSESKLNHSKDSKKKMTVEVDSLVGNHMDSEPIISWLARSSRRVKSPPVCVPEKENESCEHPCCGLSLTRNTMDGCDCKDGRSLNVGTARTTSSSTLPDEPTTSRSVFHATVSPLSNDDKRLPVVYYRRRYRKKKVLLCHDSKVNRMSIGAPGPDTCGTSLYSEVAFDKLLPVDSLWSIGSTGILKLNFSMILSRNFTFKLSCPVPSFQSCSFSKLSIYLCHAILVLKFGKLMTILPRVQLEMLIVDNLVGLRFLLFEGCLKQAVAFVFVVLDIFGQPDEPGKSIHLELPVTSIRFKFSCANFVGKQLAFLFHKFSELENSRWIHLNRKINKYCILSQQLPLSQCTDNNIKDLQNGTNGLLASALNGTRTVKGFSRRSSQRISFMNVPGEPIRGKTIHSFDPDRNQRSPMSLSFTAAPTYFLDLHRRLLIEHTLTHISFQDHGSGGNPQTSGRLLVEDQSCVVECPSTTPKSNSRNILKAVSRDKGSDKVSTAHLRDKVNSSLDPKCGTTVPTSSVIEKPVNMSNDGSYELPLQPLDSVQHKILCRTSAGDEAKLHTEFPSPSLRNGITVEIPSDKIDKHVDGDSHVQQSCGDLSWNLNSGIIPSPNPTARRSTWHRNRSSSASFGGFAHGWSEGKSDFLQGNFGNGPKKPRTQVNYAMPFGGFDLSSRGKGHQHKMHPHKRFRTSNERRSSDASRVPEKNLDSLSCNVNLLLTVSDKGWRESGVQVVLELFDHSEWRLAVKLSGSTKYSYKPHQFLQPGSTNRFTHAMMWKGGKEWILEFPDRSQWALFKEMHEEGYDRNVRVALVKNIPIPGVRLIEENEGHVSEASFLRTSKYFCQEETDVQMALNPSRVLYEIDSDDERWISENDSVLKVQSGSTMEISEDIFEKIMDTCEKAAYSRQCDRLTAEEVNDLMVGVGSLEVIKMVFQYWHQKRSRKGLPLIRHLQPPCWERYQQEVREWEQAKAKSVPLNGCSKKVAQNEKPPMFAFCLKPRGLDLRNRGSKHRSHKKLSVSGQSNTFSVYHDGFHAYGRRMNGFASGDERVLHLGQNYDFMDDSPLPQRSPRFFSPREADAGSLGYFYPNPHRCHHLQKKFQRSKSKKVAGTSTLSPMGRPMIPSFNQRMFVKRNNGLHQWPNQRQPDHHLDWSLQHDPYKLEGSDLEESRTRDASGAAQHALKVAKFKREKAQRLLCRADLAIHKAVVALMTAEAIKAASSEDANDDDM
ncbi:unnamed protein product [Linum tenue]|uniref:Enhancer of polycomb-like protein n=1 Tax=Linum tenue TaxID=586396 RepID=A0AAV0ME92_9ROSI|nr:unnamed protein product [Linum tenue]